SARAVASAITGLAPARSSTRRTSDSRSAGERIGIADASTSRFRCRFAGVLTLPRQMVEVDIAAADNDSDSPSAKIERPLEKACERHGAGRLDDDLHPLPHRSHRADDPAFGGKSDRGDMRA